MRIYARVRARARARARAHAHAHAHAYAYAYVWRGGIHILRTQKNQIFDPPSLPVLA